MNILWVENHRQFSQVAGQAFLSAHAVSLVPSLIAARNALASGQFDVVLLDYDLDDGKGSELVAETNRNADAPPIFAAPSYAAGNQRLIDAGADAVCGKMHFAGINQVLRQVQKLTAA